MRTKEGFKILRQAYRLYKNMPRKERLHVLIRGLTCPMEKVLSRVPQGERFLEVGCGHGLFSNIVAEQRPQMNVFGIDISADKIKWAVQTVRDKNRVHYTCEPLENFQGSNFDAVAVLDVLYLIPKEQWPGFFRKILAVLKPGGRLLLKELNKKPRWKFYLNILQETLSVKILRITKGRDFYYADDKEMVKILSDLGFKDVNVVFLEKGYHTPNILYTAVK